jgi:hypothetical protein
VDDTRIAELTAEVLADLRTPPTPSPGSSSSLEARVAALEAAVHVLQHKRPLPVVLAATAAEPPVHPSLQRLALPGGGDRCVMEPDRPCVESGMCRSFGH